MAAKQSHFCRQQRQRYCIFIPSSLVANLPVNSAGSFGNTMGISPVFKHEVGNTFYQPLRHIKTFAVDGGRESPPGTNDYRCSLLPATQGSNPVSVNWFLKR